MIFDADVAQPRLEPAIPIRLPACRVGQMTPLLRGYVGHARTVHRPNFIGNVPSRYRRVVARRACLNLTAAGFVVAGLLHFAFPGVYTAVVPPVFPKPRLMVFVSGVAEIAGGIGLLVPRLRRPAMFGLIALLLSVWPVHFYMAFRPDLVPRGPLPAWLVWLRLPLQVPMMLWVAWVGRTS